jgi:hypothetical protein
MPIETVSLLAGPAGEKRQRSCADRRVLPGYALLVAPAHRLAQGEGAVHGVRSRSPASATLNVASAAELDTVAATVVS